MSVQRLQRSQRAGGIFWFTRLGWPVLVAAATLLWVRAKPARLASGLLPSWESSTALSAPGLASIRSANPAHDEKSVLPQATSPTPWHWSELESSDYQAYINKLRAVGCPEQTIVDLVLMDVGRMYQARREQLEAAEAGTLKEPDEQWQALATERDQLVRRLVGADFTGELEPLTADFNPDSRLPRLSFLPPAKQVAARRLLAVAQEQEDHLVQASAGVLEESQTAELNALRARTDRQLQALLTAEEMAAYRTQTAGP